MKKIEEINKRKIKPKTKTDVNKEINEIAYHVSTILGNTEAVAKSSYIDSDLILDFKSKRLKKIK